VVNGGSLFQGIKTNCLVAQCITDIPEQTLIGPGRAAGIGPVVVPVKDHAPCPLQVTVFTLPGAHVYPFYARGMFLNGPKDSFFPFQPPVGSVHGVQDRHLSRVKRYPVVGEYGIGRVRLGCVLNHYHVNIVLLQQGNIAVEFCKSLFLHQPGIFSRGYLEGIIDCCLRIEPETAGAYHKQFFIQNSEWFYE